MLCCACNFFSHLKWLLLFFFHYIELNQLDEYIFLYCWCCYCCVSCYLYFVRFFFIRFLYGVLMSPVFLVCVYLRITLVTVGPLRYEMLVFPIHLSSFVFHHEVLCVCEFFFIWITNSKRISSWKDQRYNDSFIFIIILYFVVAVVVVVVVFCVISAFKEKKESIIQLCLTRLFFTLLLLTSILYPY